MVGQIIALALGIVAGWILARSFVGLTPADQWNAGTPVGARVIFVHTRGTPVRRGRTHSPAWRAPDGRTLVSVLEDGGALWTVETRAASPGEEYIPDRTLLD